MVNVFLFLISQLVYFFLSYKLYMNYKLAFIIFTLIILILINYTNSIKNKIKKIQFMLPSNTKILDDYKRLNINSYISSNFKIKINKSNMIYITDF